MVLARPSSELGNNSRDQNGIRPRTTLRPLLLSFANILRFGLGGCIEAQEGPQKEGTELIAMY